MVGNAWKAFEHVLLHVNRCSMSVDSLFLDVVPSADGVPSGSFSGPALSVSVEAARSGVYVLLFDVRLVCLPCDIQLVCTMSK